jgi:hypothetical protein
MKEIKISLLYGAVMVLLAYGVFTTLQERKLENRIASLEMKMNTVYGGGVQWVSAKH